MKSHPDDIPVGTHCEWCGAEFDVDDAPTTGADPRPAKPVATPSEPATHCEWCGAPYPDPDDAAG